MTPVVRASSCVLFKTPKGRFLSMSVLSPGSVSSFLNSKIHSSALLDLWTDTESPGLYQSLSPVLILGEGEWFSSSRTTSVVQDSEVMQEPLTTSSHR